MSAILIGSITQPGRNWVDLTSRRVNWVKFENGWIFELCSSCSIFDLCLDLWSSICRHKNVEWQLLLWGICKAKSNSSGRLYESTNTDTGHDTGKVVTFHICLVDTSIGPRLDEVGIVISKAMLTLYWYRSLFNWDDSWQSSIVRSL